MLRSSPSVECCKFRRRGCRDRPSEFVLHGVVGDFLEHSNCAASRGLCHVVGMWQCQNRETVRATDQRCDDGIIVISIVPRRKMYLLDYSSLYLLYSVAVSLTFIVRNT